MRKENITGCCRPPTIPLGDVFGKVEISEVQGVYILSAGISLLIVWFEF